MPGLVAYSDLHPLLVHFPVALFPTALLFAIVALRDAWPLGRMVRPLLFVGTLSTIPAMLAGFAAQDRIAHGPGSLVAVHRTWMLWTTGLAFLISAATLALDRWRVRRGRKERRDTRGSRLALVGGLLIVNCVLGLGADRGALVAIRLHQGGDLHPLSSASSEPMRIDGDGADPERGGALYQRLECGTCHGPQREEEVAGVPPNLDFAGSKLQTKWVRDYLLGPHRIRWRDDGVRPVLRMPDYELSTLEATDLASFLATRTDSIRFSERVLRDSPMNAEDASTGRSLARDYTCRGCHVLGGDGNRAGPTLDGVGERLQPAYIYAFLSDPQAIVPGTAMKDFDLWDEEARALTAYLTLGNSESLQSDASGGDDQDEKGSR